LRLSFFWSLANHPASSGTNGSWSSWLYCLQMDRQAQGDNSPVNGESLALKRDL